jgi:hypothetical protein
MSEADPMYGPPPGNPSGVARAGNVEVPLDVWNTSGLRAPPGMGADPMYAGKIGDATDGDTKARARLVYRDLPIVTVQNTWTVPQMRGALYAHLSGIFYSSALLCDSIMGDDRVCATLNSRAAGLFGRDVRFAPANDSAAAKECLDAWEAWWPRLAGSTALRETFDYNVMMGFAHDQICWDTTQPKLDFAPVLFPWHPVFTYYDWTLRAYIAVGQDAQIPIVPGNGKWMQFGGYRSWLRGCLRPVAEPWALRHFAFRDLARLGELHGNPIRKGYVPMVGDPIERQNFEARIANMGANTALIVPRGVDASDVSSGYDLELLEAKGQAWQAHGMQIDRCDMAIVLAILMQNLTTEVDGGSYGAAKVHMDVKSQGAHLDNQIQSATIGRDLARPFAYLNFGDANLAPRTWWDVTPMQVYVDNAKQMVQFGTALEVLRRGGIEFKDPEEVRRFAADRFGLTGLPDFKITQPVGTVGAAGKGAPGGEGPGGGK